MVGVKEISKTSRRGCTMVLVPQKSYFTLWALAASKSHLRYIISKFLFKDLKISVTLKLGYLDLGVALSTFLLLMIRLRFFRGLKGGIQWNCK